MAMKVGIQLYSIRSEMEMDMDAALKAVKEMGYDYVEFAGFFDKSAEEVKALLDKHGLKAISVHQGADPWLEQGQAAIDYLKTVGVEYCAIPWYSAEKLEGEAWEDTKKLFSDFGKALKDNGINLLYHNHDFEFKKFDGKYTIDKMYEEVPAELMNPEFDTCWVHYAGENPCDYIRKYNGRLNVLHLKDFVCKNLGGGPVYALIDDNGGDAKDASKEDNGFEFRPVGYGIQDFPAILEAAEEVGIEYIIVEQDDSYDTPVLETAKKSREYLKTLGY